MMKRRWIPGRIAALTVATAISCAMAAQAAEPTLSERVDALEKKVTDGKDAVANALGIELHALLAADYIYSFNEPKSGDLPYRVFDKNDNTFFINDAAIFISRNKEDENLGFSLAVDFGNTARYTGTDWNGDGDLNDSEEEDYFELREAFLTYKLPWFDTVLKAGRFTTLLGYEVFKTNTNFNPNISNSFIFGFANPFTHVGFVLSTPLGDTANFDIGVVNGWDNAIDQNPGKTLLAGFGLKPIEGFSTYAAMTYGQEQLPLDDGGPGTGSKRFEVTWNGTYSLTEDLAIAFDSVYGHETDLISPTGRKGADWYGGAGYLMYQATDRFSMALRSEVLDDPDGARGFNATVWEVTPTVAFQLTDFLLARFEYRHDEASKPIFENKNGSQSGNDTVGGELILAF